MGKKYTLLLNGKETGREILYELFDKYNKMYFNGELGKCRFYWLISGSTYGKYNFETKKNGKIESRIGMSRNVRWTDETLRDVLVHEMIHMYVTTVEGKHFDGLLGHGRHFRKHMKRLNKTYGMNIMVCNDLELIVDKPKDGLLGKIFIWLFDR